MKLLLAVAKENELPPNFNSYMYVFVQQKERLLVLLGHPPAELMMQALQLPSVSKKLLIDQDEMHYAPTSYDLWPFEGEIKKVAIDVPLEVALSEMSLLAPEPTRPALDAASSPVLITTVLLSGLADGINPCAFAVMAFFTALLFALRRSRRYIFQMGTAYIVGMYVTYFALGLGLIRILNLIGQPHIVTQVGGVIAIFLGLIQVKEGLLPNLPIHLTMPAAGWQAIQRWARRTSMPAALVLGGLVGLCTLPCSGGIYIAILGLLSSQVSYAAGLGYLVLYNVTFILPLLAILLTISSRPLSLALAGWERAHARSQHTSIGVVMVLLGVLILTWLH